MLLADNAQNVAGKLYILGAGWSLTGPAPSPSAVAMKIDVPWEATNRKHQVRIELHDSDGNPVRIPGPVDSQPLRVIVPLEVGRPPGMVQGTPIDWPFAMNVGPIALNPGRYEWRCTVEEVKAGKPEEVRASQSCAFTVRDVPPTVTIAQPQ